MIHPNDNDSEPWLSIELIRVEFLAKSSRVCSHGGWFHNQFLFDDSCSQDIQLFAFTKIYSNFTKLVVFFCVAPTDERPVDHKMDEEADKVSCLEVEVFGCFWFYEFIYEIIYYVSEIVVDMIYDLIYLNTNI